MGVSDSQEEKAEREAEIGAKEARGKFGGEKRAPSRRGGERSAETIAGMAAYIRNILPRSWGKGRKRNYNR